MRTLNETNELIIAKQDELIAKQKELVESLKEDVKRLESIVKIQEEIIALDKKEMAIMDSLLDVFNIPKQGCPIHGANCLRAAFPCRWRG